MAKVTTIAKYDLEALAEVLYPSMKEYLNSPEGKAAFEKWREQQELEKNQT